MQAYCWASGRIEIGKGRPRGTLPIANGKAAQLRDFLESVARHAYDGKTLLVPGLPEAPNQVAALTQLERWLDWIKKSAPRGIKVA